MDTIQIVTSRIEILKNRNCFYKQIGVCRTLPIEWQSDVWYKLSPGFFFVALIVDDIHIFIHRERTDQDRRHGNESRGLAKIVHNTEIFKAAHRFSPAAWPIHSIIGNSLFDESPIKFQGVYSIPIIKSVPSILTG